ncbi:MAG: hypothetical protein JNJ75_10645 [Cyclobacteriaceae bacterium]|nr:hypothetical protein [Cyclobacteriaceae bacterium]
MAYSRSLFCATSEVDFRATFKQHYRNSNQDFSTVYARVNATEKFQKEFNIHLNVLQYETTLKLKCLGDRADQTVDPYALAKELNEYIKVRDNRLGIGVLAIDRIEKLTLAQQNLLINFFIHNIFPFSTLFILPEQCLNSIANDGLQQLLKQLDFTFKNLDDTEMFFKERSEGLAFDQFGNFIRDTRWD